MKSYYLTFLYTIASFLTFGQAKILTNQYGYFPASNKKIIAITNYSTNNKSIRVTGQNKKLLVLDTLRSKSQLDKFEIYEFDFKDLKTIGVHQLNTLNNSADLKILKNPYRRLYEDIHENILTNTNSNFEEENLRQLLSVLYTSFTDSIFSTKPLLINQLLSQCNILSEKLQDSVINNEKNIKKLLLASTCLSLASFAEKNIETRKKYSTQAMKLYIKAFENKNHLDLRGLAAFQLYLTFKEPTLLKDLMLVLDNMTWPQNFKEEDTRLYFLSHFANVYNITDGFLVKNVSLGQKAAKDLINDTPDIYSEIQLTDYATANLLAFQSIKEIKYLDQLLASMNKMSGLNETSTNYFEGIKKNGSSIEKRKLLLLLNYVNLMI